MIQDSKSQKWVIAVVCVLICLAAVFYVIKSRTSKPGEEPIDSGNTGTVVSSNEKNNQTGSGSEALGMEEDDEEPSFEKIDLYELPYRVTFHKITFELKDCMYSKNLCGQLAQYRHYNDHVEYGENGEILNGYSYLHVTFSLKNERAKEFQIGLNNSKVYVNRKEDNLTVEIGEMFTLNRTPQEEESRRMFLWTLAPGEEEEFTVSFLLEDGWLTDDYELRYHFSVYGMSFTKEVDGKTLSFPDAKFLLLDHVIRAEGEERKENSGYTSESSSQNVAESGNLSWTTEEASSKTEGIRFWQAGDEVQTRTETVENGEEKYTRIKEFTQPVFLRDDTQLKEFSALYGLEGEAPLFEMRSPFDGSEAEYIKIDECIRYYFRIPGKNTDFRISWNWNDSNYTDKDIRKEYEWAQNNPDPAWKKTTDLVEGEPLISIHHEIRQFNAEFGICWTEQGEYLFIDGISEDFLESNPEIYDQLIRSIQEKSYLKNEHSSAE